MSKPTECTSLRVNPKVNYGLWIRMMRKCRCTDYNKYTATPQDVDREGCGAVGAGLCGKSLYSPPDFAVDLKLL